MEPVSTTPAPRALGRYRVLGELGRGGMGVVYRAQDESTGRVVALKVLLAAEHAAPEDVQRFLREAALTERVRHPCIVGVHDHGWADGRPYLAMDLVEGPTLESILAQEGRMAPVRAARLAAAVARGLHAAHSAGLVHRDVKPGNVLLDGGVPRLTDFGLARELADHSRLTATGHVLGTPTYMAPEQATNRVVSAPLADQYSLGAVLYEMLTGSPPYEGESAVEVMVAAVAGPPPPLDERVPGIPQPLVHVVERAMARDPRRRFADCQALADDLERFARGESIRARPLPLWVRWSSRLRPLVPYLLGMTATFVAATGLARGVNLARDLHVERLEQERALAAEAALARAEERAAAALEQGGAAAAADVLEAFGLVHEGTPAVSRAWLRHAGRLGARGQGPESMEALARAYSSASSAEVQDLALLALAAAFQDAWDLQGLRSVVNTLDERLPGRRREVALARPRAAAEMLSGDLAGAARVLAEVGEAPVVPILEAWSTRAPGPTGAEHLAPVDWDGDGRLEILAAEDGRLRVLSLAPGLPERVAFDDPAPDATWRRLVAGRQLVSFGPSGLALWALEEPPRRVASSTTTSPPMDALGVDLDGDGALEVYVGLGSYERRLLTARDGSFVDAVPTSRSDVMDLLTDGRSLWVATGAWYAYDVRRFEAGDEGLRREARRRVGWVPRLSRLSDGRLVAVHGAQFPTRLGFPADAPTGLEAGVWLMDPDTLVLQQVLRFPHADVRPEGLVVADVDGDGDDDIAVAASRTVGSRTVGGTLLWVGVPEGFDGPHFLGGAAVQAVAQLDDDPALEALAWSPGPRSELRVLGIGTPEQDPPPSGVVGARSVPDGLEPAAFRAWARAESLVRMGLVEDGAAALLRLGEGLGNDMGAQAILRAGELREQIGDLHGAAATWGRIAPTNPRGRELAARAWLDAHRFPEAASLGADLPWLGDEAQVDLLRGPQRDPALWWSPEASLVTADGLAWRAVSHGSPVLASELHWDGRHLAVEIDLTLRRLEWGGGVELAVGPLVLGARGWGGGGFLEREVGCLGFSSVRDGVDQPDLAERWQVRLDLHGEELLCEVVGPDGRRRVERGTLSLPPGRLDLRLHPATHAPPTYMLADVVVHRLTVASTSPRPADLPPTAVPSPLDADLERWHDLRRMSPSVALDLARELGTEALPIALDVFSGLQHAHPDDPVTQRVYTADLVPLLTLDLEGASPPARAAAVWIWALRGAAWARQGQVELARHDLQRAATDLAGLEEPAPGELRFRIEMELASLYAAADPPRAREHLRRALAAHPQPDLADDLVQARPELRELRERWP